MGFNNWQHRLDSIRNPNRHLCHDQMIADSSPSNQAQCTFNFTPPRIVGSRYEPVNSNVPRPWSATASTGGVAKPVAKLWSDFSTTQIQSFVGAGSPSTMCGRSARAAIGIFAYRQLWGIRVI